MKQLILYTILLYNISLPAMKHLLPIPQDFNIFKKLKNKIAQLVHKKPEQLNLSFFEMFKIMPDEIKLQLWHAYNQDQVAAHDIDGHKFMITFDQHFSSEQLEHHITRYKDCTHWYNNQFFELLPRNYDAKKSHNREHNQPLADKNPIHPAYAFGPNINNSYLELINVPSDPYTYHSTYDLKLRLACINKDSIDFTLFDRDNICTIYCIHPEHDQFLVSLRNNQLNQLALLTIENNEKKITEISKPAEPLGWNNIRFGPEKTLIHELKENNKSCKIIHYDYEKNKVITTIDIQKSINDCLRNNKPEWLQNIYQDVRKKMHSKKAAPEFFRQHKDFIQQLDKYCPESDYHHHMQYHITLLDFIYPTKNSNYIILKFNLGLSCCSCITNNDKYFTDQLTAHFALYNITTQQLFYIGDKKFEKSRSDGLTYLPKYKSFKNSIMYYYFYDFNNYQSSQDEDIYCYDDDLNTHNQEQNIASRKLVAIVPDDDITRLENMILATVANNWCKENKKLKYKSTRDDGNKILNYLQNAHNNLITKNNPQPQHIKLISNLINSVNDKLLVKE